MVYFFSVSYDWDPAEVVQGKARRRDALLTEYRALD
jgi:hypothetical protein